ncbi:hypothetical protein HJFPF1_12004 [Paramyrothecium foliicola]|nr:hypothetical protein HJFPF1_12004 [Paramyrothecium foliicola]
MQFTTGLFAIALAAAGVAAAPNPLLAERQTPGLIYVRFYPQPGCTGQWLEDTVYFDDQSGTCRAETLTLSYASWQVERNEALRTLTIHSSNDCTEGDDSVVIPAGSAPCESIRIGSAQFS